MEIKAKKDTTAKLSNTVTPHTEEIIRARTEKKEQKKKRAEKAIQNKEDHFAKIYRRATAKSYIEYAVVDYLDTNKVSASKPSSSLNSLATVTPNKSNK